MPRLQDLSWPRARLFDLGTHDSDDQHEVAGRLQRAFKLVNDAELTGARLRCLPMFEGRYMRLVRLRMMMQPPDEQRSAVHPEMRYVMMHR